MAALILTPPSRGAGRFAPTPTGDLHLGNARTALIDWLMARKAGLRTILRIEDLDPSAIPKGCLEGQYADLDWLGLIYDEDPRRGGPAGPYRQSKRFDDYAQVIDALNTRGLLYPCRCSRREVRNAARAPHADDEGPVYTGTCTPPSMAPLPNLSDLPKRGNLAPSLRLNVTEALQQIGAGPDLAFEDGVQGTQSFAMADQLGDFVVRRRDGVASYQVACSWDDVAMGCTQVVRGSDLLPSAARQLLILRVLGLPEPQYFHLGLVRGANGERLAKRDGAISLKGLRAQGMPAAQVVRQLARLSGLPETANFDLLTEACPPPTQFAAAVHLK